MVGLQFIILCNFIVYTVATLSVIKKSTGVSKWCSFLLGHHQAKKNTI